MRKVNAACDDFFDSEEARRSVNLVLSQRFWSLELLRCEHQQGSRDYTKIRGSTNRRPDEGK